MIVMLRAELVKLRRPLVLAVLLLSAALAVTAMIQQQSQGRTAERNIQFFDKYIAPSERDPIGTMDQQGDKVTCYPARAYPAGSLCQTFLAEQVSVQNATLLGYEQTEAAASLTQNPLGAGTMVGGTMASMLGFMLVIILGAGHVGGEWTERTLRTMLIRQPRRWKIVGAKAVSLWLVSAAALAAAWIALIGTSLYYHLAKPLSPTGTAGFAATNGLVAIGRCLLVLAVYSLLATALATLTRGVIGTLVGGVAIGGLSLMAGYEFAGASQHEFVYWVTGFMGYRDPRMIGTDEFWLATFKISNVPTVDGGLLGLVLLAAISVAVGVYRFQRAEVTL